jgi:hypothetical protein
MQFLEIVCIITFLDIDLLTTIIYYYSLRVKWTSQIARCFSQGFAVII